MSHVTPLAHAARAAPLNKGAQGGQRAHRFGRFVWTLGLALLLGACAGTPPAPDWQGSATSALNSFTSAYLAGNTRVADFEFSRAKAEVARTGRADLMARVELTRCAAQVASLDFSACTGYAALAADASPAEQSYAAFLAGHWRGLAPLDLPPAYRDLVAQTLAANQTPAQKGAGVSIAAPDPRRLEQITEPLPRLIATAILYKQEHVTQTHIGLAIETASNQGWRRPLLAWLSVARQLAQAAGDASAAARLQRRIELVLQNPAR